MQFHSSHRPRLPVYHGSVLEMRRDDGGPLLDLSLEPRAGAGFLRGAAQSRSKHNAQNLYKAAAGFSNPLISLARPTGIEPVFPP
jgi:hypothetical protein